jgi:hypothetical protein
MKGGQRKHDRQEAAIIRTEATILSYEELLTVIPKVDSDINFNPQDEKKRLKKKIERAQTTVKNTKENMK